MIAVLGGLGAAVAWAATMLTASRASPLIGSWSTLAWVMLTGLLVVGPVALAQGRPEALDRGAMTWLAIAGFGNITGLLLVYTALRIGKVGVIAPLSSTEGAVAAIIAVAAGETLGVWTAFALLVVAVGVVLAARPPAEPDEAGHDDPRAALLALAAAGAVGVCQYGLTRARVAVAMVWLNNSHCFRVIVFDISSH